MNELYIVAVYSIKDKLLGMKAVAPEVVANAVMAFGDMAHGETDKELTREKIDHELSMKKIFRKNFRLYQVAVKKLNYIVKKPIGTN